MLQPRCAEAASVLRVLWRKTLCQRCVRVPLRRYVLTQFNSHVLNTHISKSYPPVAFGGPLKEGFVDVLAATQTPESSAWYRGSADAVRRNLHIILEPFVGTELPEDLIVLSGQALYRMVFLLDPHRAEARASARAAVPLSDSERHPTVSSHWAGLFGRPALDRQAPIGTIALLGALGEACAAPAV
jgi:Nucleotidyl transferase